MGNPSAADAIAAFLAGKAKLLALIDQLEAISPDVLKGDEEALRAVLASIPEIDSATLAGSLGAALAVLKAGRGISGGGFDAFLS